MASAWFYCSGCKKDAYGAPGATVCDKCKKTTGFETYTLPPGELQPIVKMSKLVWTDYAGGLKTSPIDMLADLVSAAETLFFRQKSIDPRKRLASDPFATNYVLKFESTGTGIKMEIWEESK